MPSPAIVRPTGRLQARFAAALMAVMAATLAGCFNPNADALDIRLFAVSPDPLVIDLDTLTGPAIGSFRIDFELTGSTDKGSCAVPRFTRPLGGLALNSADYGTAEAMCQRKGDHHATWLLDIDPAALRTQPSGSYTARVDIGRCVDRDVDPTPGAQDCTRTQRDFTIELRGAAPPAPPPQPLNLAAAVDGPAIVLTWADGRSAQSYVLERSSANAAFGRLATLAAFSTTYRDNSAPPNLLHTYRLTAINATGASAPAEASAQIGVSRSLTVTVEARGDSVSSSPPGVTCPGICTASYPLNSMVTLTAAPASPRSRFVGWTGDADCSDGVVTMDADKRCTATFTSAVDRTVTLAVTGNGRVISTVAGIDCPGQCSNLFTLASSVFLTATPSAGWVFMRWTGDADCNDGILEMTADRSCSAVFAPLAGTTAVLTVYLQGSGSVSAVPAGLVCTAGGAPCSGRFARGQVVTLNATPAAGSVFSGWAGSADCADGQVTMSTDLTCVANFASPAAQWFTGAAALNQGSQFVGAAILEPAITVDAGGQPVVAWTENGAVYVYRPVGVGVTRASVSAANGRPSLAMQPSDEPLVAFAEETATERRNVRLRRYSAGAWVDVGPGPLDTLPSADAWDPCVVIRNGRITVAWVEGEPGAGSRVVVRSWDGAQWSGVGSGSGPAPTATGSESQRPRLVVSGAPGTQSLALLWGEDFQTLRVAELVGDNWVATTAPYSSAVQPARADMMWTTDLGLVVAAAPAAGASLTVRRWAGGQWSDVGSARGDADARSFVLGLAFSHGTADATPLLAYAISRANGAVQETLVERFVGGSWARLGNALAAIDRHRRTAVPRAVAVADHATPEVAVVLQGVVPGTASVDHTLAVQRFE